MKKRNAKRLVLSKETLLNLDTLQGVHGAEWSDAAECPSIRNSDCADCESLHCGPDSFWPCPSIQSIPCPIWV